MNSNRTHLIRIATWARRIAWISVAVGIFGLYARIFYIILAYTKPNSLNLYGESIHWGRFIFLANGLSSFFWIGMMFVLLQGLSLLIHRLLALESRLSREADRKDR